MTLRPQKESTQDWKLIRLGDYVDLSNGKGITKKQMPIDGDYPVYGSSSILGSSHCPLIEEKTICIGRVGACGALQVTDGPCWISDNAMYVSKLHSLVDIDWLFYLFGTLNLPNYAGRTSQPSLPQGPILNQAVLLPQIAVQERIVQILQKADDIRRKRREALKIAEAVLPALFHDMFGEYLSGHLISLGEGIESIQNGITRRRKTIANEGTIVLRIQDVGDGFIDYTTPNRINLDRKEQDAFSLEEGDMLLVRVNGNPNLVGRTALFEDHSETVAHNDHLMRIRFHKNKFLPEFVDAYLRTPFGKTELRSKVATSAGNHTINQGGVKSVRIPNLSRDIQQAFIDRAKNIIGLNQGKLTTALTQANTTFDALLNRAFTGELTAAWETAHAEEIAAYQRVHEQLPALLLLAFIQAKAEQTARHDAMLITALMKYTFLAQMEGEARRRLFHFVPYHYGPFSKEVYDGLEELQRRGVVTVEESPGEGKTRITLADPTKAAATLADLPDDLRVDVQAIVEQYGALEHSALLQAVYEKYPAYAKKSRLRSLQKSG